MDLKRKTTVEWVAEDGTIYSTKKEAMAHAGWQELAELILACVNSAGDEILIDDLKGRAAELRRLVLAVTRGKYDRAGKEKGGEAKAA